MLVTFSFVSNPQSNRAFHSCCPSDIKSNQQLHSLHTSTKCLMFRRRYLHKWLTYVHWSVDCTHARAACLLIIPNCLAIIQLCTRWKAGHPDHLSQPAVSLAWASSSHQALISMLVFYSFSHMLFVCVSFFFFFLTETVKTNDAWYSVYCAVKWISNCCTWLERLD